MNYWDRPTLKQRAKDVLRKSYWMSLLVVVIYSAITYIVTFSNNSGYDRDFLNIERAQNWMYGGWHDRFWFFAPAVAGIAALVGIFSLLYKIFVVNVLEIGSARFFTMSRYDNIKFGEVFYGFKNGHYADNVKTMFMRDLFTFLWSLLFIIPGIVKYLSYWMIPYILAENPNISMERAFEISKKTTYGEKSNIFVLYLSFIGWHILAGVANTFTFGLATYALMPYPSATFAELYGALRNKAVTTGICTRDEIGADIEIG